MSSRTTHKVGVASRAQQWEWKNGSCTMANVFLEIKQKLRCSSHGFTNPEFTNHKLILQNCSFDNKSGIWKTENNVAVKQDDAFEDFKTISSCHPNSS